jgi:heptosyltransferase II
MEILVIKLGAIGDVIRTTSILPGLRKKYPGCSVDWVTKKESYGLLKNNEFLREVYLDTNAGRKIIRKSYDWVICLDDEDSACALASAIDCRKLTGSMIKDGKRCYTDDSSEWFDMGLISRFGKEKADALKAKNKKTYQSMIYGILGLEYSHQEPVLNLGDKSRAFAQEFREKNKIVRGQRIIGLNTGAGGRWEDKKLSVGQTLELINMLDGVPNAKIILFGGPEEKERNAEIKKDAKGRVIDAGCDNSLAEFASLIGLCDLLITSDSLALHIATALKKKIAVFFYPTSAAEIELYGRGMKIIGKGKSCCSYQRKCTYPPEWDIKEIVGGARKLLD